MKEAPYSLIAPDADMEVLTHATTCLNPNPSLGSHRFEIFSSWKSLRRAIASIVHIALSLKNNEKTCRGWHRCESSYTPELLTQAENVIIRCVQKEAYKVEIACLENEKPFPNKVPSRG